mmetsp:Transcript_12530/g.50166  ORF Transcript_12530/g.50166 Transcript_12530/m.50166 type:complete len:331 (-) Transcript_12530:1261-2253(-)
MQYVRLGNTGVQVSRLGLGGWLNWSPTAGENAVFETLDTALAAGVNFFDTAESYGKGEAETLLGKWISKRALQRSSVVVCTKIFWEGDRGVNQVGLSRKRVVEGMRASLARLQLESVDVVLAHRPDPHTPLEETVRAFNHIIDQGMAYYWGTSEWHPVQIARAQAIAKDLRMLPPQVEQPQYSLLSRANVDVHLAPLLHCPEPLGLTVWSPLASGLLSGKYNDGTVPAGSRFARIDEFKVDLSWKTALERNPQQMTEVLQFLSQMATRLECSQAQLALAWCMRNPAVSVVITGASSVAQLKENMGAMAVLQKLTPEIMHEINTFLASRGH